MSAAIVLALVDGALSLVEKLIPSISAAVKTGEITVEQQKEVMKRVAALRDPAAFSGPEWQVSSDPKPPSTPPLAP